MSLPVGLLYAVVRGAQWWDGTRVVRGMRRDHWQSEIGCACLFTRRDSAARVAARVGRPACVVMLVPTELPS